MGRTFPTRTPSAVFGLIVGKILHQLVGNPPGFMALALTGMIGLSSPALAQSFYKWVDAAGATHYSHTPPPASQTKAAKKVKVDTHTPVDSAAASQRVAAWEKARLASDAASDKAKADKSVASAKDQANRQQNTAACNQIHANQALIDSGRRLSTTDSSGTRTPMTEAQKQQMSQQNARTLAESCPK